MIKWLVAMGYALYLAKKYVDDQKNKSTVADDRKPTVIGVRG